MTTETSNARGEWVLVPRVLVDSFPEINPSNYDHGDACALNAWGVELVLAAKDTDPPPAAALGDVRGLVALAERVQYADTHALVSKDDAGEFVCLPPWLWLEIRDAAVEALAAEGVQAGEVELIDRGVSECLENGDGFWRPCSGCYETSDGHNVHGFPYSPTFRCNLGGGCSECGGLGAVWDDTDYAEMALSQQPEARGVVDEAMVERAFAVMRRYDCFFLFNDATLRRLIGEWMTAALTEARNVR